MYSSVMYFLLVECVRELWRRAAELIRANMRRQAEEEDASGQEDSGAPVGREPRFVSVVHDILFSVFPAGIA